MDHRLACVSSQIPQQSWTEEPEQVCSVPTDGGGGTRGTSAAGTEGAGGTSSGFPAPVARQASDTKTCGAETLTGLVDCAAVALSKGKAPKTVVASCLASSTIAVNCIIDQFRSATAK